MGKKTRCRTQMAAKMRHLSRQIKKQKNLIEKCERTENALRDSETSYRRLFETAKDGILILDAGSGEIKDVNPFLIKLLRYPRSEFIGKKLWQIGVFKDRASSIRAFLSLQKEKYIRYEDLPLKTKGGDNIDVEFVSNVYRSGGRDVIQCNIRDITERRKVDEILKRDKKTSDRLVLKKTKELLAVREKLLKAKRLSDIGSLAATVAHELRNPLGVIKTACYNIKRKAENRELHGHIGNIEKKISESEQIIQNLLVYSRIKMPNYENVSVVDVLTAAVDNLKSKYKEADVVVNMNTVEEKCAIIRIDPVHMSEICSNILDNACQSFTGKKGEINVDLQCDTRKNRMRILFKDNGVGMAKKTVMKAFEPFFTTRSKGTGLGLAVCRELVSLYGGKIGIKSGDGEGTTVAVELPIKN